MRTSQKILRPILYDQTLKTARLVQRKFRTLIKSFSQRGVAESSETQGTEGVTIQDLHHHHHHHANLVIPGAPRSVPGAGTLLWRSWPACRCCSTQQYEQASLPELSGYYNRFKLWVGECATAVWPGQVRLWPGEVATSNKLSWLSLLLPLTGESFDLLRTSDLDELLSINLVSNQSTTTLIYHQAPGISSSGVTVKQNKNKIIKTMDNSSQL